MKSTEIIFKLNEIEKIVITLEESIKHVDCCYRAPILYFQGDREYLLENGNIFSVRDNIQKFINLVAKALSNKLVLHPSLKSNTPIVKDIGYFFNESRQNKPGIVYDEEENGEQGYWVGMKYMLWAEDDVTWMYNNESGDIIFEITPCFPGKPTYWFEKEPFSQEEIENSLWYEQWIKDYKPLLIREIPREVAQKWLDQAHEILETIEENIVRMKEEERKKELQKYEIVFVINDLQKIIIQPEIPISEIDYCSMAQITFFNGHPRYLVSNYSLYHNLFFLRKLLISSLSNELQLPQSLSLNKCGLGYFFNEYHQGRLGSDFDLEESDDGLWIGQKYLLWIQDASVWVYNDVEGNIVFEVAPYFPIRSTYAKLGVSPTEEEIANSAWYEEWIKDYKPILIRILPREVAQKWLDQANEILEQIEKNIMRMRAKGNL